MSPLRGLICALPLFIHAAPAHAFDFALALDDIRHPAFAAERVRLQTQGGATVLRIGKARVVGRELRDLRLTCREFSWNAGNLRCRGGSAKVGAGETARIDFSYVAARKALDLAIHELPAAALAGALPELAAWQPRGVLTGALHLTGPRLDFDLATRALGGANAEGSRAGEGIALRVKGTAHEVSGAWHWQVDAEWQDGEVFVQPWYLKGAGQGLVADGVIDAQAIRVDHARLVLPAIGSLEGRLRWDRHGGSLTALEVASERWDAAAAFAQWLQPLLGETPQVRPTGSLRFALALDGEGPRSLDLDLDLARLDVGDGRLVLAGLRAMVPWRREAATQAQIHAAAGKLGALDLGPFAVPMTLDGWRIACERVAIPLLDGELLLEDFHAQREAGQWRWQVGGALLPLSMPRLSEQLGLPQMDGLISAVLPRIHYADGVLALDGRLIVSVFDGYLAVEGLKLVEPFGRAPRLVADIDARHLDLAMLTQAYAFGSITGYIDAEVRGLEMVGWQPQAFLARIETSPGGFKKRISQRAVQNISSLGGAGAGAAIQRSFLRFFDTFGYQRIGLSCALLGGVCTMGGLREVDGGYLMVEGGGLPALNVIGYNRQVGWDVLVSRLREIAAGNSRPVIE